MSTVNAVAVRPTADYLIVGGRFMRRIFIFLTALSLAPLPASAATLEIVINEVRNAAGVIHLAFFADADSFPMPHRDVAHRVVQPRNGSVRTLIEDLPSGRYAVAVFHDENDNQDFDLLFGILPREGYGFSNDAHAVLRPPAFEQAAFDLSPRGVQVSIDMVYPGP